MITDTDSREKVPGWANEHMVQINGQTHRYDTVLETKRSNVTAEMPHAELRALFPYKVRLKEDCKLSHNKAGYVYDYACANATPQAFPMRVMVFMEGSGVRKWYCYNSQEAELIIPKDTPLVIAAGA